MFKKWDPEGESVKTDNNGKKESQGTEENVAVRESKEEVKNKPVYERVQGQNEKMNTILKGSKLTGDINVICDLTLSGDVEGNITSLQNSNIVIKGKCKGNIETKEGSVNIEGELNEGNIIAGNNVSITGKYKGGEVRAKGQIYINGVFDGNLEANEIEIGSNAQGKGELHYKDYISIAKGAKVDVQISQDQKDVKAINTSPISQDHKEDKVTNESPISQDYKEVKGTNESPKNKVLAMKPADESNKSSKPFS